MAIDIQTTFTEAEAMAICEMIAKLIADDYEIMIDHGEPFAGDDGIIHQTYKVSVTDYNLEQFSAAAAYRLIDALTEAYQMTPERTVDNGDPH